MIRAVQTFRVHYAKRLILGLFVLILYGESLLAWTKMQEEPSVSVFLAGTYPDQKQMKEILDTAEKAEKKISACFYWEGGLVELSDGQYGRTSQALLGGLYGDPLLYDSRLNGFSEKDKKGCVIDRKTSVELFGTEEAKGRTLVLQGREYLVRKVLPWKQQVILIRPDQEENTGTRLFLEKGEGSREDAVRQFLMSYGLSGTMAPGDFLRTLSFGGLLLFPAEILLCLFVSAWKERRKYGLKEGGFWMWTAAMTFTAGFVFWLLWNRIEIPRDWIPGQWSDFSFWQEKIQTAWESVKLYLMLPKTVLQTENILLCFQSLLLSFAGIFLSFFWNRV